MANSQSPTGKIEPQPWLTSPQTKAVIKALEASGGEARFVGGCVRDALLKRPVNDVDIATTEPPEKVMELLETAGIKAIPTGLNHGTVTAVINEAAFQITTLRIDVKTDGRHAEVAFTDNWQADAARRDFTINTMSCTLDGDVYDPLNGMRDLAKRHVRFVGNARERIEEDVLRMLRYFRIYAAYGAPPPDIAALVACRALAPRLTELSGERIRDELLRIIQGPNPANTVQLMRGEGVLNHILPEAGSLSELRQLIWLESSATNIDALTPNSLRRLAALLDKGLKDGEAAAVAKRLVLSKKQTARLLDMVKPLFAITPEMDETTHRRALKRMGKNAFLDATLLAWAAERALTPRQSSKRSQSWIAMLESATSNMPPPFPLTGHDVKILGVPEGPHIGGLLTAVEEWWEDGAYEAKRDDCLAELKRLAKLKNWAEIHPPV